MLFSSNKFGIASSELEESNSGRCTGVVRGLTAGASTHGGTGGGAGGAAPAGPAKGRPKGTFMVTLTGSCFTGFA